MTATDPSVPKLAVRQFNEVISTAVCQPVTAPVESTVLHLVVVFGSHTPSFGGD